MMWRTAVLLCAVSLTANAQGSRNVPGSSVPVSAVLSEETEQLLRAELAAIPVARRTLLPQVISKGRSYVKLVRHGVLPLRQGFDALMTHAARVELLSRGLSRDLAALSDLDSRELKVQTHLRELKVMRRQFDAELGDFERSRDAIAAAREREAAFRRAFSGASKAHTAVYSAKARPLEADLSLRAQRGRLPLPVGGRTEVEAVNLEDARGPGLQLTVAPAAEVAAVHGGKVVLVSEYTVDTHAVLLDHGDGFTSLTGGLVYLRVRVGDRVHTGDVLGSAVAGGRSSSVYFELREGGRNVQAEEWFGL